MYTVITIFTIAVPGQQPDGRHKQNGDKSQERKLVSQGMYFCCQNVSILSKLAECCSLV